MYLELRCVSTSNPTSASLAAKAASLAVECPCFRASSEYSLANVASCIRMLAFFEYSTMLGQGLVSPV